MAVSVIAKGRIRRACPGDIDDVLRLLVQVDMVHHNGRPDLFKGPATKYTAEELREIFADDTRPVFVFETDNGNGPYVAGYAFCVFEQNQGSHVLMDIRTLYVDDICVDENARGQHIGTQLYEYVKRFAKEQGCYHITLNVWSCNPQAMRFYEACGMHPYKVGMETIL